MLITKLSHLIMRVYKISYPCTLLPNEFPAEMLISVQRNI